MLPINEDQRRVVESVPHRAHNPEAAGSSPAPATVLVPASDPAWALAEDEAFIRSMRTMVADACRRWETAYLYDWIDNG